VHRFRPRVEPLPGSFAGLGAFEALERLARVAGGEAPAAVLLEGGWGAGDGGFDLVAVDPVRTLVAAPGVGRGAGAALGAVRAALASVERAEDGAGDEIPGSFGGGFLGALAYDLGAPGEELDLPRDPWGLPGLVGGIFLDFLVRDRTRGETFLVLDDSRGASRRRAALLERLRRRPSREDRALQRLGPLVRHVPPREYRARVERARAEIERGEIYQANVTQRFSCALRGDPLALYRRLRARHPAPHLGFLRCGGLALLSVSPELLLEVEPGAAGPRCRTRPIKGTAARSDEPVEDARRAAELLASEKDLAELAMIVDLERNDLGRVATVGSVRVDAFPRLESYTSVHHLVADVCATAAPGKDALDVLAALFPGGSITGAPKLRSMEVIAGLEEEGRGFAFGSLGRLDLAGRAAWNLLIRTAIWRSRADLGAGGGEVTYRVGGGITWASDPRAEERESLDKGAVLARVLRGLTREMSPRA